VLRCVAKFAQRTLAAAFDRWVAQFQDARRKLVAARKVLARMAAGVGVAPAFVTWLDATKEAKAWRGKVRKTERLLTKISNRTAALAFERWSEATLELLQQRLKLNRAVHKLKSRAVSAAFNTWYDGVRDAKEFQRAAVKAERILRVGAHQVDPGFSFRS